MRLIENSDASRAYRFGFNHLWPAFAEQAWLYVVFIALDAVFAGTLAHDRSLGHIAQVLATFPVLAFCGRLLRPGYRMTARDVMAIVAMVLILMLLSAIFFAIERVVLLIPGVGLPLLLGALASFVWIALKLSAGPLFWVATRPNNVIAAFVESWSVIQGSVEERLHHGSPHRIEPRDTTYRHIYIPVAGWWYRGLDRHPPLGIAVGGRYDLDDTRSHRNYVRGGRGQHPHGQFA